MEQERDSLRHYAIEVKPVGAACNLRCAYCYYLGKGKDHAARAGAVMSDEVLEQYISQVLAIHGMEAEVEFAWHGGEPTLAGIGFYRKALALQRKYGRGRRILNTLQTNGTLLDDDWCSFFKDNAFRIGLSIDGPERLHNIYRIRAREGGSFSEVMRGLGLLIRHGVEFNTLTTVNAQNADHAADVYNFLRTFSDFMQFLPVVERVNENQSLSPSTTTSLTPSNTLGLTPGPSPKGEGSIYLMKMRSIHSVTTPLSTRRGAGGEAEGVAGGEAEGGGISAYKSGTMNEVNINESSISEVTTPLSTRRGAGGEAVVRAAVEPNDTERPADVARGHVPVLVPPGVYTPLSTRSGDGGEAGSCAGGEAGNAIEAPFNVSAEAYGRFLCTILDEWARQDVGRKFVQVIEATIGNMTRRPAGLCVHESVCGHCGVVEKEGDVYRCDRYVFPQYRVGNIMTDDLGSMMQTNREFGEYKFESLPTDCLHCDVVTLCWGGCPKDRLVEKYSFYGKERVNILCKGYRTFFRYAKTRLPKIMKI